MAEKLPLLAETSSAPASEHSVTAEIDELLADSSDFELPQPELSPIEVSRIDGAIRERIFGPKAGGEVSVGRYRIVRKIGGGGVGIVYEAFDDRLHRRVALKVLRQDLVGAIPRGSWILDHEAQALAKLTHPNVVTVYDLGQSEGVVYIAMELVEGRTLRQWVEESRPTPAELLSVFRQVAMGLWAAHDAGLVHRDLKPENILVNASGHAKILDFGLGRMQGEASGMPEFDPHTDIRESTFSTNGNFIGTPTYMSPEQHLGEEVDARSDQFSFGVVIYEMLVGVRPFAGTDVRSVALAIVSGKWQVMRSSKPLDLPVVEVLRKAMHVDPNQRFANVRDLAQALEEAARTGFYATESAAVPALAASVQVSPLTRREDGVSLGLPPTMHVWGMPACAHARVMMHASVASEHVYEVANRTFAAADQLMPRPWLSPRQVHHESSISRLSARGVEILVHRAPQGISVTFSRSLRTSARVRGVLGFFGGGLIGGILGAILVGALGINGEASALLPLGLFAFASRRGFRLAKRAQELDFERTTAQMHYIGERIREIVLGEPIRAGKLDSPALDSGLFARRELPKATP
jgi:serine/threonine protein kinase